MNLQDPALTLFDRNLIVTAGAGTGKTTLLSRRIVHLLIKDPPVHPWRIAALTFTRKAAAEMGERVRQELRSLLEQKQHPDALRLAQEALSNIERMEISTIHAFAGMLLRLFPLEAGVDPNFNEDESGERFERFFEKEWEAWLEKELGRESENSRRDLWRKVLSETTLPSLSAAARSLCNELIPLDSLTREEHETLAAAAALLLPFVARIRQGFAESGALSFEGLIARARDLLARNPAIRERMKAQYDAILVDEFQDTDPIQYESILYLAEEPGRCADRISDIRLAPGKLFIVGDPKQSIYSFRHADLAAYERVKGMILEQGGMLLDLSVNFRSSQAILECVNGLFASERMGLVPAYQPLTFGREGEGPEGLVLLRLLKSDLSAAESAQAEARSLARFLSEEVIGRERIVSDGSEREVRPGDVAILFPAMTHVASFVRALREEGLPFVVEGSRTFYGATEVITMVNLLRVVVDPADQIALLGLLRSPLIALSDREIARIAAAGFFRGEKCPLPSPVGLLLETIRDLREELARLPLSEWVQSVLEKTPLLAACAIEGEHAIANISKLLRLAEESDGDPEMTPLRFIRLLSRRVRTGEPEGEGPLGEEMVDAIRLLTIHKAKGLEFPYVILASLGSVMPNRPPGFSGFNWEERSAWFTLAADGGRLESAAAQRAASSRKRVREEEQRRLLYVGMTRARDRLILSGAAGKRGNSLLSVLREVLEDCGIPIRVDHLSPTLPTKKRSSRKVRFSWNRKVWEKIRRDPAPIPLFFSPTSIATEDPFPEGDAGARAPAGRRAAEIGEIVHRLLEGMNFSSPEETIRRAGALSSDAHRILVDFVASPAFKRLRAARILGREVPFTLPWDERFGALGVPRAAVVEGIADLVLEEEGRISVIDYKTDRITLSEAASRAARYRLQGLVYAEAVRRLSGKEVAGAEILFLRLGISTPIA